jgi:hypothetical protein
MNDTELDPLCLLTAFDEVLPIKSLPPQGTKEHRQQIRYMVSWKAAVTAEGQDLHEGKVRDISLHGAAILLDRNFQPGTRITLHIQVPFLNSYSAQKTLTVHGQTSYTVHDANSHCFRTGIAFTGFELESDRVYLEERLTKYQSRAL